MSELLSVFANASVSPHKNHEREPGRLEDMETEEVSLVDRAANQRTFLVVKNKEGTVADTNDSNKATISRAGLRVRSALRCAKSIQSAIEKAEVSSEAGDISTEVASSIRSAQSLLKSIRSPGAVVVFDESLTPPTLTETAKSNLLSGLSEAVRRLEAIEADAETSEILDAGQIEKIAGAADILGSLVPSQISKSSLEDEPRRRVQIAITKAITDLNQVNSDLGTTRLSDGEPGEGEASGSSVVYEAIKSVSDDLLGSMESFAPASTDIRTEPEIALEKVLKDKSDAEALAVVLKALTSDNDTLENIMTALADALGVDTKKIGRPMQGDRLTRLKSAVGLLREAIKELRGGSVSMEKFKKVASVLGEITQELATEKSALRDRGFENDALNRGLVPDNPNQGSGVQPDTSTTGTVEDVMGQGVPAEVTEVIKEIKEQNAALAKQLKDRDKKVEALANQVSSLKKARSAPIVPSDPPAAPRTAPQAAVAWPQDMADPRAWEN